MKIFLIILSIIFFYFIFGSFFEYRYWNNAKNQTKQMIQEHEEYILTKTNVELKIELDNLLLEHENNNQDQNFSIKKFTHFLLLAQHFKIQPYSVDDFIKKFFPKRSLGESCQIRYVYYTYKNRIKASTKVSSGFSSFCHGWNRLGDSVEMFNHPVARDALKPEFD